MVLLDQMRLLAQWLITSHKCSYLVCLTSHDYQTLAYLKSIENRPSKIILNYKFTKFIRNASQKLKATKLPDNKNNLPIQKPEDDLYTNHVVRVEFAQNQQFNANTHFTWKQILEGHFQKMFKLMQELAPASPSIIQIISLRYIEH